MSFEGWGTNRSKGYYTLQKAADTFDVGAATVSRYLRRYRQTGDLTPRTSPGRPSALNEYQAWVEQSLISNDLTHDQRCDLLFEPPWV